MTFFWIILIGTLLTPVPRTFKRFSVTSLSLVLHSGCYDNNKYMFVSFADNHEASQ